MLRWTQPPEPGVVGYRIYRGTATRVYDTSTDVGLLTEDTVGGTVYYLFRDMPPGTETYVAVTAYNYADLESTFSNERIFVSGAVGGLIADAGPDQVGTVGQTFTIGSANSAGNGYYWEQLSGPATTISGRTQTTAQFTPVVAGTYAFSLAVSDTDGIAITDTVSVLVTAPIGTATPTRSSTPTIAAATPTAAAPTPTSAAGSTPVFSTYVGGSAGAQVRDIVTDSQGNIYVTGGTPSTDFPTTTGAYDRTHNGSTDVFVTKLSPTGQLLWSTLLGGPNYDRAYAIELDPQGNVVVAGRAGASFPTTAGVVQRTFGGDTDPNTLYGQQDGFIAKIAANGGQLLWATYFGGPDRSFIRDIALDSAGNVYLTMPEVFQASPRITAGAYQTTLPNPECGIVAKVNPTGTGVTWCSYLGGGTGTGRVNGTPSIRVTANNEAVVLGSTLRDSLPTPNGFDTTRDTYSDWYLAKFSPTGAGLLFATYVGGNEIDVTETHQLALDPRDGGIVLAATTKSTNLPFTTGAFQSLHGGSATSPATGMGTNYGGDGYILRLSPTGVPLASTYLGGTQGEGIEGVSIDAQGRVFVSGATYSSNFPVTTNAAQPSNRGQADFFVAVFSSDLRQLLYGSYLGGSGIDSARTSTIDGNSQLIVGGDVASTDWSLHNAFITSTNGNTAGMAKLDPFGVTPPATPTIAVSSATPTRTHTRTPTRTPTTFFTPTRTATATLPASATRTPTRSPTGTRTPTRTPSLSPTPIPSATRTPSATVRPSASPTATASRTATASATVSPTHTAPPTGTATRVPTATPTTTASRTATASATMSPTFTAPPTGTATRVPTATPTTTASRTATSSATMSPTFTAPPTGTATRVPTATAESTATETPMPSATASQTATASATVSPTSTAPPAATAESTPTLTAMPTATASRAATASATVPPTSTGTATHIATATPPFTATPTATRSATASRSATPSATVSPTRTAPPTSTATAVPTSTTVPAATRTRTASRTPTASRTATPTASAPPVRTAPPTSTASRVPTSTPVSTETPRISPTATLSRTPTSIPSASPTQTAPPSSTATRVPTSTAVATATRTTTPTASASRTQTPTATPSATQTATHTPPSATATAIANACGDADAPQCDGACPGGLACVSVGDGCQCITGVGPCGRFVGAPSCWGDCPPHAPFCVTTGGACLCSAAPAEAPTPSPSATATRTRARTTTRTPTASATPIPPTATRTPTPGETLATAAPTATLPDATATATATDEVPTSTATATIPSPTDTPTQALAEATATPELTPRNPPATTVAATPTPTFTQMPLATRTETVTPTVAATPLPTDTKGPTPVPTETATATPTATTDRSAQNNAALYVASGMGGGAQVAIHFLRPPRRSTEQMLVAFTPDGAHSVESAPVVPVLGDIDADGMQDLVVGQAPNGMRVVSDQLAVYRVRSNRTPELVDEIAAFPGGSSASGNLAVADVDPTVAGEEILVGEDGFQRRASVINVIGLVDGNLRHLRSLRVVATHLAEHHPLAFVPGELDPELPGREIAVAHPNGYVSVHTLSVGDSGRVQRFDPFVDQLDGDSVTLAIGDVLPQRTGNEIIAGIAGRRDAGLVRVLDWMSGSTLLEVIPFTPGTLRTSVSLWVADVVDTLPGAELIIGQGSDGGRIVVYNLATSTRPLFDLPDTLQRASALSRFLAIGDLIPNLGGLEVAVAQPDRTVPVHVYRLTAHGAQQAATVSPHRMGTVGAISAPAPR